MTLTKTARGARLRGLAAASALTACALATLATPRTVLAASIDQIQQQIQETSTAYDEANARVESVQAQIDANEQRIAQIEDLLPGKRAAAADSIRLLYKMQQGTGGLLDLLLSSEDFNSLIATIQYLDVIQSHNYDAVSELASLDAELQQTRSDLATQQAAAESDRQTASDALAAAKAARAELEQQMAEQAAAEEAERQAAIQKAQADAASGDSTFTTGSGEQAAVEVPAQPDPDPVDWQSQKDTFVAGWATRIDAYLAGSPLAGQGTTFAEAAWAYGVDPRFSPAISAVESSKGLYCFRPHNAWGWGSSSWNTWEDAIWDHVAGLASGYGGHLTYAAAQKYCPPNAARWYSSVLANMERI